MIPNPAFFVKNAKPAGPGSGPAGDAYAWWLSMLPPLTRGEYFVSLLTVMTDQPSAKRMMMLAIWAREALVFGLRIVVPSLAMPLMRPVLVAQTMASTA